MEQPTISVLNEDRYRKEVLLLPSGESENDAEQKLIEEARKLGLELPEVEIAASLAASMAFGVVDLNTSPVAARPSIERSSISDVVSLRATSVDRLATSLSGTTVSSEKRPAPSIRSRTSLSTRPTSYSSSEGKLVHPNDRGQGHRIERSDSAPNVTSPGTRERKRASFISAMGKLPFRKKRTSSTVLLPSTAQITVKKGADNVDKVYIETKRESNTVVGPKEGDDLLKVEVPVFDEAALRRSVEDPELKELIESHKMEGRRHIALQKDILNTLKDSHRAVVAQKQLDDERAVNQKREQNIVDAVRLEERQLAAEIDQQREFEKAKMNSHIRIRHMEAYCSNPSPPPTPRSETSSDPERPQSVRKVTRQQKEQLAQEYHDRDSMDQLHEAKIKVLRDKQEMQLQEAIARMEGELQTLIHKNAEVVAKLEREFQQQEQSALQAFDAKKAKLKCRWNLEEAILRRKLELQNGQPYGPLPPLSFTDLDNEVLTPSPNGGTPNDGIE